MALAAVAFAIGAIIGANGGTSSSDSLAGRFVAAWSHGNYAAMYAEIDEASRRSLSADQFASNYHDAMRTATATSLRAIGKPRGAPGGFVTVPVRVRTRLFGTLAARAREDRQRRRRRRRDRLVAIARVPRDALRRDAQPPHHAAAAGDAAGARRLGAGRRRSDRRRPAQLAARRIGERGRRRSRPDPQLAPRGPGSGRRAHRRGRRHERPGAALDAACAARPAASCWRGSACSRAPRRTPPTPCARASRPPCSAPPWKRSARSSAASSRSPPTGQILAVAGIGLNSVQPPGSTFKMVTLTGVLDAHVATPHTTFPTRPTRRSTASS